MDVKLTLSYADLRVLFRAKVWEYFLQVGMFGRHENHEDRALAVEAYVENQFPQVLRHLDGKSVGAEASDMTAAFMTNYSMRKRDYDKERRANLAESLLKRVEKRVAEDGNTMLKALLEAAQDNPYL